MQAPLQTTANSGVPTGAKKMALDPPVSEAQRKAMWAAKEGHSTLGIPKSVGEKFVGAGHDDLPRAAGVALRAPDGDCLFIRRSGAGDHAGEWAFPGGYANDDEDPEAAAIRELAEELGFLLNPLRIRGYDQQVNGLDYVTFVADVDEKFAPKLNDEASGYMWAQPAAADIFPLHPGVKMTLDSDNWKHGITANLSTATAHEALEDLAPTNPEGVKVPGQDAALAFDRASVRDYDADGRMHVAQTNISKANVCPYIGKEIPDWQGLGLQADRIYHLLRDPEELKKAVGTFNGVPLLITHKPHSAAEHDPGIVIGATGTDAVFEYPYLKNSLVVWPEHAIDAIESEDQKELSCGYRYRADMTPGNFQGSDYDGVMRDIVGNHVALVREGRAGSDVVVGDSKEAINVHHEEISKMNLQLSRKAALAQGALMVFLRPKLAADSKLPPLAPILKDVTAKNFIESKPAILEGLNLALKDVKLAKDAKLDDMHEFLDSLDKEGEVADEEPTTDPDDKPKGFDAEQVNGLKDFLKDKVSEDTMKALDNYFAGDDPPDFSGKPVKPEGTGTLSLDTKAMDERIKVEVEKAIKIATDSATKIQMDIREAENAVRPYIGQLKIACDSADKVYRTALEHLGVKGIADVHASALPHLLKLQPLPGAQPKVDTTKQIAMDASAAADFHKRVPGAARISVLG